MNKFFSKFKFIFNKKPAPDSVLEKNAPEGKGPASSGNLFMHLSLSDQITFIKELSVLIRAGVPLLSSLSMLKEQSKSKTMITIMDHVVKDISNGQSLAISLGRFKKIFGELTINIISVGELSGTLSDNLDYLALNLKKKQALQRKIIGASIYPIFIVVATVVITAVLTVFVFPKLMPIFKSVSYDLPITTKMLIFISSMAQTHGILILVCTVIFMVCIWLLLKIKKIRFLYERLLLHIPFINKLVRTYNITNVCRTVGLLLNGGITVVKAFQVTADTTPNLIYKEGLNRIAERLTKGGTISEDMHKSQNLFPLMMSQIISVGESTGKLVDTFSYLSEVYEVEMDDLTRNLSTTLEPVLLLFMGVLVGFIAISIITPIYGITQHLSTR